MNSSFRAEDYEDPEKKGRMLSEFTLIEPEGPYENIGPEQALNELIALIERIIKNSTKNILKTASKDIEFLGGNLEYLNKVRNAKFNRVTYDEALKILSKNGKKYEFGSDLGIREEREILKHLNNIPTFVTHFPAQIKFFNMKRLADGKRVYSVDLLLPKLGESAGGALREQNGEKVKQYLFEP